MSASAFTGVVLAGGKSSRMGSDKRYLVLAGQTLLQRSKALLHAAGADEVLLSGDCEGEPSIVDLLPALGPPGALYSVLCHLEQRLLLDSRRLLLLPVDMPLLTVTTLQKLLNPAVAAEAMHFEGEVFPCVFPAKAALLEHLRALFRISLEKGGPRSMKALFSYMQPSVLSVSTELRRQFRNINTPEEWQALQTESSSNSEMVSPN